MPKDASIFQSSRDPKLLVNTAVEFAASEQPIDHATLAATLNSDDFLGRLNTQHEYDTLITKQLRVAKVIKVLRDSPHGASKQTLIILAQGGPFINQNWRRQELLVRALVTVRPATPPAIRYWDEQSQVKAVNRHVTVEMLCENGTEPAMALLEKKLIDPRQEQIYKVSWIRAFMLPHRNDLELLKASKRMIIQTLPLDLRYILLEALVDYDMRWYPCCYKPKPPPRLLIQDDAKQVLREICRHAKANMDLTPGLKLAVEKTLLEIGDPEENRA
jgi:hypothetical protein